MRRTWPTYWAYILISVLIWLASAIALLIWTKVPARAVPLTFLLLEIIMLAHIFGRLWQKACATTWYWLHPEPVASVIEPPFEPFTLAPERPPEGSVSDVDAP